MTTLGPSIADDTLSAVEHHPTMTPMPNTNIETLTAFKDTLKSTPIKAVFESLIVILTLVRVSFLALFPLLHSLISDTVRMR